jgi:uncharacterized protein
MRIAVVGSGVSGLVSAWLLSRRHSVVLFEANDYLGGHTHTHDILLRGRHHRVDTGFVVFNPAHYPLLTRLFSELGVAFQPAPMSFSVRNEATGLEYNATSLRGLFCQRRNLVSARFWGMMGDLLRFYREAPRLLEGRDAGPTLGEYLERHRYGAAFRDDHIVPMASALWSSASSEILRFPARYLVQFMANHQMLTVSGRTPWQVVKGGSSAYIKALTHGWTVEARVDCPVRRVSRGANAVEIESAVGREQFDQVVFACHSDQTLRLLADPSRSEQEVLGAIEYQANMAVLHTDATFMPQMRSAWAAWNALVAREPARVCTVSYSMNLLQGIESEDPLIVTLNPTRAVDPRRILRQISYHHPLYSHEAVAAQGRKAEIQGQRRSWFAGAYWGWGFHEDGLRSAVEVAEAIQHGSASPRARAVA